MENNLNQGQLANGNPVEDPFADIPEIPDNGGWNDNNFIQDQQFFPPFDNFANQFPAYDQHQAYQNGYGNYYNHQQYQDPNAFYNHQPMPFQDHYSEQHHELYQPFPDHVPQNFHQPHAQQQPANGGNDYRNRISPHRELINQNPPQEFQQPPQPALVDAGEEVRTVTVAQTQDNNPIAYPKSKSEGHRSPPSPSTSSYPRVITPVLPYEDPMRRMKELTRQSYGGSLAASAAAVEAAEARRNSPPVQKKEGAEMTVKDALQKHYREQRKQKKQLHDQYYRQRLPNTSPVPTDLIFPKPPLAQQGIHQPAPAPSLLVHSQPLEQSATTPATQLFTLPPIDTPASHVDKRSPPNGDVTTLLHTVTPLSHFPTPPSTKTDKIPLIQLDSSDEHNADEDNEDKTSLVTELSHPNTPEESLAPLLTEQQRKDLNNLIKEEARAKTRSFMLLDAIKGIPLTPSERNLMQRRRQGLHPGTFSLIAKQKFNLQDEISGQRTDRLPSTLTRKRPLEEKEGTKYESLPLKPGPRTEINENGEKVERVYVHVHHANVNDPDWTEDGVIMTKEEFHRQEKRTDMISYSYETAVCPYQYCLWRVKRFDLEKPAPDSAAPSQSLPSLSSRPTP